MWLEFAGEVTGELGRASRRIWQGCRDKDDQAWAGNVQGVRWMEFWQGVTEFDDTGWGAINWKRGGGGDV